LSNVSSFLYYEDYDNIDETTRDLYRQGMAPFGGISPTYHILLLDKPTIVWDFYSLLLGTQMMFSFMLTDERKPLRCCRHCQKAFAANHPNAVFCSPRCKNQYNVYKGRAKKRNELL
jgi:predicted nucleic acid-binding Zn ribbon protein